MAEKKKILLVDDDSDFRGATKTILESAGYEVIEASTGKEGFEKAKSEAPDLAVIDIIMESFSEGFNLIKQLGADEWTRGIPRIVLTSLGLQQEMDMITPEELGTRFIMQKPVKSAELLALVDQAISTAPQPKKHELGDTG
jgi:two-component system, OmpR family, alkaline phosphatase synthesis response regulator PhoP